jgi:uncharacterized protein
VHDFLTALGLLLAIEGILFAAFPAATRKAMAEVVNSQDSFLRRVGLVSALLGVFIVFLLRGFDI